MSEASQKLHDDLTIHLNASAVPAAKAPRESAAPQRKKTLAEIAEEHGIDMSRVEKQNDQFDVLTGKRVALD